MSRQVGKQEAHLSLHTLSSPDTRQALHRFCQLFKACAGPRGRTHAVTNTSGGHLTVTGSCSRLLSALCVSRPELKLITSAVTAHLQHWRDGGLFMIHTACRLVLLASDLDISRHILHGLFDTFVDEIITHFNMKDCGVKVDANLHDLNVLLAYVRSVLSSKCLLNLTDVECDVLSQCVLKAFLDSVPNEEAFSKSDRVYCVTVENQHYSDSCVESGLLLLFPDKKVYSGNQELQLKTCVLDRNSMDLFGLHGFDKGIKVALITCSLSGDFEETIEAHFELTRGEEEEIETMAVETLLRFCESLEESSVGFLLCQKVIHPRVKAKLRSCNICFIDRLGSQAIPYIQDLTGAKPITSIVNLNDLTTYTGWVISAAHQVKFSKSYLLLNQPKSSVVTYFLCGSWEEKVLEMKICVKAALLGLGNLFKDKKLLMGGGCWQVYAAQLLKLKVLAQLDEFSSKFKCSKAEVLQVLTTFRASLLSWALALKTETDNLLTDQRFCHAWKISKEEQLPGRSSLTCSCGLLVATGEDVSSFDHVSIGENISVTVDSDVMSSCIENPNIHPGIVVDNFGSAMSGLKQAVNTANLLLSIGPFIIDRN